MKALTRWFLLCLVLAWPCAVQAQIANPSTFEFTSPDHTTIIAAGEVGAGQAKLSSYQGMLFNVSDNPASGVPVVVGPVISKTLAALQPAPAPGNTYRLTRTQMGIVIPTCTTATCPQYTLLLVAIGPGGTSARSVASESDPFTAAVPVPTSAPAGPVNVKALP
jgi:hypothetical protein